MKTNNLFFYVALLVGVSMVFSSCSKDDDPVVTTDAAALIGSWDAVSQQLKDCPITTDNATNTCGTQDFCFNVTFTSEIAYTEMHFSSSTEKSGSYVAVDGVMGICLNYKGCQNWIYTITGNQLQLQQIKANSCSEVLTFTKI
jgi:hypothetical protein